MDAFPEVAIALAAVLGLLIGSFLNVVIHRLPIMLERQWAADCLELAQSKGATAKQCEGCAQAAAASPQAAAPFSLMRPASRCPHCGHQIQWFENIPVLSYLVLRGKCAGCKAPISFRYPAIELLTGVLFAYCAWRWGLTWTAAAWCAFCAALVSLTFIDWDTTLLPDDITLPLVWMGILLAALNLNPGVSLFQAVWGAVAGYLSLWAVYWLFKLVTGKEGMGYGDFKLFAALGAWFGWQALIPLILLASIVGAIIGIAMKVKSQLREGGYIPFGPFLAGAGFLGLFFGPQTILRVIGL